MRATPATHTQAVTATKARGCARVRSGRAWRRAGHWLAIAALVGATFVASGAQAQNLDLDEAGALLVLPIVTGDQLQTATSFLTVTNAGAEVKLHLNVLSGDPGDLWVAQDFECPLTAHETVLFTFTANGAGSEASWECSGLVSSGQGFMARNGVLVVTVEDAVTGETLTSNQIFGDAVVLDHSAGAAYSVGAIPFQGIANGPGTTDRRYRFDNLEYSAFPSKLAANYVPTDSGALILFTLDGTTGSALPPEAALSIKIGNGRGGSYSSSHHFDCFDIVDLSRIDGRFGFPGFPAFPARGGSMNLSPEPVTYANLAHDSQFDGGAGNVLGTRRVPVHGWLFQQVTLPSGGLGAFGRPLSQSQLPMASLPGDTAVLNAP